VKLPTVVATFPTLTAALEDDGQGGSDAMTAPVASV
jgi:hypothetical protein